MAINLVEYPNSSAPVENTDWTDMYALVAANGVPQASRLTGWATTAAAPSLAQGVFIRHEGNYYQVQGADETISGTVASGINYIKMTLSGSVLSASWTNSLTGFSYDPAYGALYNTARDMLLTEVCYLDGSDYVRGYAGGADFNTILLANGNVYGSDTLKFLVTEIASPTVYIGPSSYTHPALGITGGTTMYFSSYNSTTGATDQTLAAFRNSSLLFYKRSDFYDRIRPYSGISAMHSLHGSYDENDIYDAFNDVVDSTYTEAMCTGVICEDGSSPVVVSKIQYISTSRIRIYGLYASNGAAETYDIDNGGTLDFTISVTA